MVEHEFFGVDRPSANVHDRHGAEAREIRGLSVEEHINRLGPVLIPLAERCARVSHQPSRRADAAGTPNRDIGGRLI